MTLGEKIASARKEKGMTQEMLAEQLGVTRQAVARWETVGLLLLLLILIIVLFLIATGKSGIVAAAKSTGKRMLYLIAAMLLALVLWSVAFVA